MLLYLLDSDVIIEHFRNNPQTIKLINDLGKMSRIGVSVLTLIEVKSGARQEVEAKIEKFFNQAKTISVNLQIADLAANLMRDWKKKGKTLYLVDATIAATCLVNGLTLVTYNKRDYPMKELKMLP